MDATPPCAGQHELFDSTDYRDHLAARAICYDCPFIAECRDRLKQTLELVVWGGNPQGTWAGELYGQRSNSKQLAIEERMFSEEDARAAHAAFYRGDRSPMVCIGERVYQRRSARNKRNRSAA